jgi:hypothetical protein
MEISVEKDRAYRKQEEHKALDRKRKRASYIAKQSSKTSVENSAEKSQGIYNSKIDDGKIYDGKTDEVRTDIRERARARPSAYQEDFTVWYERYPRKKAKADAQKAYQKARYTASAEEILAGLDRYNSSLSPGFDQNFVPYPASWLRAGRWGDEYTQEISKPAQSYAKPLTFRQAAIIHNRRMFEDALSAAQSAAAARNMPALGKPTEQAVSANGKSGHDGISSSHGEVDGELF